MGTYRGRWGVSRVLAMGRPSGWRRTLMSADLRLFWYVHMRMARRWLDRFMRVVTHLGGVMSTVGLCTALILMGPETRRVGYTALFALSTSHLLVQLLKRQVERPRPYLVLADRRVIVAPLSDYSFPSGHTTASFAIATVLAARWPAAGPLAFATASIVGLSRTYLGHHYPSDVLAGAAIGILFAYVSVVGIGW
ncbi:phosphatase PAP2 family protein [Carboxydochorda subterranea]|uniref:Phosphatase PAP2 family protein n=1 Tax=Carboxydichorda subterranea TaxID=3109565 RepID=A0ABZ1BZY3_9FIRM|nr:phosphatase PAP2 family protein [Limnochorda sp. L945t]WRP18269.1 phosphatase PAP2 family protein [Limnochorda sp. L945t]